MPVRMVLGVAILIAIGLAAPALAQTDSAYRAYVSPYCEYHGTHEHWDNYPSWYYGGATTGIVTGYSSGCNRSEVKIRYYDDGLTLTKSSTGYQSVTRSQDPMEELHWSDHNVRRTLTGVWAGWRLYH